MRQKLIRLGRILALTTLFAMLASCEPPAVYGSVGYSSYSGGGYHGGGGFGTSVTIGGRIY
jgi:hypothetical protein